MQVIDIPHFAKYTKIKKEICTMDEIKFFLKFGERKHLEDLQKGNLFFFKRTDFSLL